jgi:hypothetical protein
MTTSSRNRNNNIHYTLKVNDMYGEYHEYERINNLQTIADTINANYFSCFPVVSRAMVSNWVYKPDTLKRPAFNRFIIDKVITG